MQQRAHSMTFFERRFNALLHDHDQEYERQIGPFVNGDPQVHEKLAQMVAEIAALIAEAALVEPASPHDIAVLIRMAIINLGIDPHGDRPGHQALRSALRALDGDRMH